MQNNTIIDSWVDWFGAMDSGSAIDKAHLESLFTAFDASHPVIDCKAAVTKHKETVFLAKLSSHLLLLTSIIITCEFNFFITGHFFFTYLLKDYQYF